MPDLDEQIRELVTGVKQVTAQEVIAAHSSLPANATVGGSRYRRPSRMNNYALGAAAMATAICVLVLVLVFGFGVASTTKPTVITPARPSFVPASWQKVTFGGLTMYAPGNWPVEAQKVWGDCATADNLYSSHLLSCLIQDSKESPIIARQSGRKVQSGLSMVSSLTQGHTGHSQVSGESTPDSPRGYPTASENASKSTICRCAPQRPATAASSSLRCTYPVAAQPVAVEIGLAGGGKVAHTIEYSMRAAGSTPKVPPTTPTTTKPNLGQWSERTVIRTGPAQDIIPTSDSVYWLSTPGQPSASPQPVTPMRYNSGSGQVTKGPSLTGFVGSPSMTVADGWVWVVAGVGNNVVVEQFHPTTLALHATHTLALKTTVGGYPANPVVTATTDGPLWVGSENDLWKLSPSTGAPEAEFNIGGVDISSMSTNPTGTLLYVGGSNTLPVNAIEYPVTTEYNAQTGAELYRVALQGATTETVAATSNGVWVSFETGLAGIALELSAHGLHQIAGQPTNACSFGAF